MARKPKTVSDSSPLPTELVATDPTPEAAPVAAKTPKPRARKAEAVPATPPDAASDDASPRPAPRRAARSRVEATVEPPVVEATPTQASRPARARRSAPAPQPVEAISEATEGAIGEAPVPEASARAEAVPRRLGRKAAPDAKEVSASSPSGPEAPAPKAVAPEASAPAPATVRPGVTFRSARTLREEAEASEPQAEASAPKAAAPSAPLASSLFGSVAFRPREGGALARTPAADREERNGRPSGEPRRLGRRDRNPAPAPAPLPSDLAIPATIEPPILDAPERGEGGLPLPTFRATGAALAAATSARAFGDRESAPVFEEEPRESRRGRRDARQSGEGPVSQGDTEPPRRIGDAPKPVKPEARPLIDAPADAPQVIVRPSGPVLVHQGRVVTPFVFFADLLGAQRAETVRSELKMAADAGVHLHAFPLVFEGTPDSVEEAAAAIEGAVRSLLTVDPKAMALVRLDLQAPRGWDARFADGAYRAREGKLAAPSIADDRYWAEVRGSLKSLIARLSTSSVAASIVGVQFDREGWEIRGGYDASPAAAQGFRKWLRTRYLNDAVMLRAAWFDGSVDFSSAEAPARAPQASPAGLRFVRADRKGRRYVDYHLYLSDATVARIADLAYAVKEASGGRMLFGARYGDTFEDVSPARGQLSLGKLLRTPEVDFVSGPPSDASRGPGGSAGVRAAVDSIALNGKLYLAELDYRTSLAGDGPGDEAGTLRSPQALDNVHSRDLGFALAHGAGTIWMDRHGRGALNTPSAWNRAEATRELLDLRLATEPEPPDVAVFLDERALAYVEDAGAFGALVRGTRDAVLRAGVSAGFYLLSDLAHRERFPESKVYIFLNAWDVRADLRSAIKARLQKGGKTLCWLYAAGLFDGGRDSLERVREVTGIALRPQPFASRAGTSLVDRRNPLAAAFAGGVIESPLDLEPTYSAIPEDAAILGEYTGTGLPSFVVRRLKGEERGEEWTSVFLGEPAMNPELVRALAQGAGAHVWSFSDDVVHARPPFLTVHASSAGNRAVVLPHKWSAANAPGRSWAALDASSLKLDLTEGATQSFLVGPRDAVQRLMDADVDAAKRVDRIPPRESNERIDVSNFDLPIVKLDAWTGGAEATDDIADEWFLRPQSGAVEIANQAVPVTADSADETTRTGRRKRRDGRDRDGRDGRDRDGRDRERGERDRPSAVDVFASPELPVPAKDGAREASLNVVFRKRS